jgi:putative transcriptional regulator
MTKKKPPLVSMTREDVLALPSRFNYAKVMATTDAEIAEQIADDPDTAPDVTTLPDAWRIKPRTARRKLGNLTQRQAAKLLRIGLGTLRNWEQGRTLPDGPAKTLLLIAEREPKAVLRALKQE